MRLQTCGTVTSWCCIHHSRQFRDSIVSNSLYKVLVSLHLFFSSSSSQHTYLQWYSSFPQHRCAMSTSIKITPSMVMSSMYTWLEKYAHKEATVSHVLHNIEFELGAMKASFHEDSWMDILDHIVIRPNGWDEVRTEWGQVKSGMSHFFSQVLMSLYFCKFCCSKTWEPGAYPDLGLWWV